MCVSLITTRRSTSSHTISLLRRGTSFYLILHSKGANYFKGFFFCQVSLASYPSKTQEESWFLWAGWTPSWQPLLLFLCHQTTRQEHKQGCGCSSSSALKQWGSRLMVTYCSFLSPPFRHLEVFLLKRWQKNKPSVFKQQIAGVSVSCQYVCLCGPQIMWWLCRGNHNPQQMRQENTDLFFLPLNAPLITYSHRAERIFHTLKEPKPSWGCERELCAPQG